MRPVNSFLVWPTSLILIWKVINKVFERHPSILLLQARAARDPILSHELDCFVAQSGLDASCFHAVNLVETEHIDASLLDGMDVVMVGGSGDYSVVKQGFVWLEPLLELMRVIVARKMPMFASCFGFQALVLGMGGELITQSEHAELGTFLITLSAQGLQDPLFGCLDVQDFYAQLGHNDSVICLPHGLIHLASSERCEVQAVRVLGAPIVATQFHPELTAQDNIKRYMRYVEAYKKPGESLEEAKKGAMKMHCQSPVANRLIRHFIRLHVQPLLGGV